MRHLGVMCVAVYHISLHTHRSRQPTCQPAIQSQQLPELSQDRDNPLAVVGLIAAQLSSMSHRNGKFPPTKNKASGGSSRPQGHTELAYINEINSSDTKDAPHMEAA